MAKIISSLPGSTGVLSKTSQLTNDGESGVSTYVELDDISTVATTGNYSDLINIPSVFTPSAHTHNISDISGIKSEFNTSLTDGDFLFEGDITQYTDELAQDAVGSILTETATIDFTYDDITPTVLANVKLNSIDATHLVDGINITEFTNNANYETTSQLNIRDINNRNRVNHTGEQPISTVTGLQTNLDLKQDALGFTPESVVNKVTDISIGANNTTYPSSLAVKTYADNLVVGMLNDRGTWDASVNVFPTTGGSGVGGAIRKGDMWYVSVAGTLGTKSVNVGDSFRALVNAPAQVTTNWSILEANIGHVPENVANKATTLTASSTLYPNNDAVIAGLATKISGTLTTNRIPKSSGTNSIGDSSINDNGSTVSTLLPIYANSFVKPVAVGTNILLANGSDLVQTSLPISVATQTALDLKANLASPTFTGIPTAPTATAGTNTTQIATTAFVLANSSSIPQLESNSTDLTVWNNGKGNISSNTIFGELALKSNTTGSNNTSLGQSTLRDNTIGVSNTAIGSGALGLNTTGSKNVAIGSGAGQNVGHTIVNNSVFIGDGCKPLADNQTNQIVIGENATGAGSNTATLGNASITKTVLRGAVETNGSFINSTAPATNVLLAGGTTLSQNTAFNKNFGTTAGTVVEGNDSRVVNAISGTGTTNYLPKFTSAGVVGNSLIFDSGTNVGIGTSTPSRKLTVNSDLPIRLESNSSSSGYYTLLGTNYNYDKSFLIDNRGDEIFTYSQNEALGLSLSNPRVGNIRFSTNGSERMRIASGGNVLINTSTDNELDKLQVNGAAKFTNSGLQGTFIGSDQGAIDIKRGTTQGFRLFSDINGFGIYDLINNLPRLTIENSTGGVTILGRLKATCPIYANDAAADADVTLLSGQFYKLTGSRAVYQKP